MTKIDKAIMNAIKNIEEKLQFRWTSADQDHLNLALQNWTIPDGLEYGAYAKLLQIGANKTASSRACAAGEFTFASKDSKNPIWIKKENLPYAVKNSFLINAAILKGDRKYRSLGPGGLSEEKWLPTEKLELIGKPPSEGGALDEKGTVYYSSRQFLKKFLIEGRYYYLCSKRDIYEVLIADVGDIDTQPRNAPSSSFYFVSEAAANLFINRAKIPGGIKEETLPPSAYDEFAKKIVENRLKDVENIPPRFSLLVRVCEITEKSLNRKDAKENLSNRLWPILRNSVLFDVDGDIEEEATLLLQKVCLFPSLNDFSQLGEAGAHSRAWALVAGVNVFNRHFRPSTEKLIAGWKSLENELIRLIPLLIEKWVLQGKLTPATSFEVLDLTEVEKLLGFLGEERLDLYHWCILALSCGMRIDEVERFLSSPDAFVVEDGFVIDHGKLVTKIDTNKKCEMPLVAMIIYRNLDRFPTKGFENTDLNLKGRTDNIRNHLKKDGLNFYRRRLRTTCSSMLARCQNETSQFHQPVSYLSILERGAWMQESTAREHYIKSLPGQGIVPDKYFSLRDPAERLFFSRQETFKELVEGVEVNTLIDCEYDLLEGQIAWDAWLLRHFIKTHLKHIEVEHKFSSHEKLQQSVFEFKALIFGWQELMFNRTGWIRKYDPGTTKIVTQIQEGNLLEAEATLEKLILKVYPERPSYKEMVRTITNFFDALKNLTVSNEPALKDPIQHVENMVRACSEALLIESKNILPLKASKFDEDEEAS